MKESKQGTLLRVFVGESDHYKGKPVYEAIVLKARELHLAGATVLRGMMGFGAHSRLHTAKILRLSEDLPIVIEIVDERPPVLGRNIGNALIMFLRGLGHVGGGRVRVADQCSRLRRTARQRQ